jgi:type IV pilus assembly protein PilM
VIKDHYIRFVESDKKNRFLNYGQKCLPDGVVTDGQIKDREVFEMILDEIIDEGNLKGSKMSFCIPDSFMIIRKTLVPFEVVEDELKGHLYMQLGETIHLPFDDPILEAVSLKEKEGQNEVLLIASKESVINEFSEAFKEASLKPVVADLSNLSLYRLLFHLGVADKDDHILLIHLGLDTLQLSVFHEHKPEIFRHSKLSFNLDQFELIRNRSGQEFYEWKDEPSFLEGETREIITEIERFMSFYRFSYTKGNDQITRIVLTGDHPCMEQFERSIHGAFEVDIQSLLRPLFQTKKGYNIPPIFNDCIGLALK